MWAVKTLQFCMFFFLLFFLILAFKHWLQFPYQRKLPIFLSLHMQSHERYSSDLHLVQINILVPVSFAKTSSFIVFLHALGACRQRNEPEPCLNFNHNELNEKWWCNQKPDVTSILRWKIDGSVSVSLRHHKNLVF